jgi:cell wall-associated NlpC family hydrolase
MTRDDVVNEAKSWLGTPYHHMAHVKGAGVDCGQLLVEVFHAVGLAPRIDLGQYPSDWHFHRSDEQYLKWINQYCKKTDNPKKGDIVLFKFGRCISHGAIITDMPYVIHAHIGMGVICTSMNDAELFGRFAGYYTLWSD